MCLLKLQKFVTHLSKVLMLTFSFPKMNLIALSYFRRIVCVCVYVCIYAYRISDINFTQTRTQSINVIEYPKSRDWIVYMRYTHLPENIN